MYCTHLHHPTPFAKNPLLVSHDAHFMKRPMDHAKSSPTARPIVLYYLVRLAQRSASVRNGRDENEVGSRLAVSARSAQRLPGDHGRDPGLGAEGVRAAQ